MPLASDRAASLKREQDLADERERLAKREGRNKRRRTCMPSTISSSILVNENKAKRRRESLRGNKSTAFKVGGNGSNDENEQPNFGTKLGPTAYVQVSQPLTAWTT